MNILYAAFGIDVMNRDKSGVYKKILGQSGAIFELGFRCDVCIIDKDKWTLLRKDEVVDEGVFCTGREFVNSLCNTLKAYDALYVRSATNLSLFFKLLKYAKAQGKKVIVETPTYPVYAEQKSKITARLKGGDYAYALKGVLGLFATELYLLPKMVALADEIVCISYTGKIKGKMPISIDNGIDACSITQRETESREQAHVLISVANISFWHGFDRVVNGISDYIKKTGKKDIEYKVVGDGENRKSLEALVKSLGLEDVVKFYGFCSGDELSRLFDDSDIAIGSIACHRKNLKRASTLKSREYCARAIPFVTESCVEEFDESVNAFVYQVPADESPVDVEDLLKWYASLKKADICKLREYAEQNFCWTPQMKKITDVLRGESS